MRHREVKASHALHSREEMILIRAFAPMGYAEMNHTMSSRVAQVSVTHLPHATDVDIATYYL